MEERRADDKTLPVLVERLSGFMERAESHWVEEKEARNQVSITLANATESFSKEIKDLTEKHLRLPCEGRRLVYLENKSWVSKNLVGLWTFVGIMVTAIITLWIQKK